MAIEFSIEHTKRMIASIKQFFAEFLDQDIGDLKASFVLDFISKEIGPAIYNKAVADTQACMQEMVSELDGTCHEPESNYWKC